LKKYSQNLQFLIVPKETYMNKADIENFLKKRTYWYHKIELLPNLITPGFDLEPLWDNLRMVRASIDYNRKRVLDIAAFDGMFTFEAEKLGASSVIATDCMYKSFENFLFCREVLKSNALPYFNVSPYNLTERLDVYFQEHYDEAKEDRRFDIVQHLGLLYHLRDPMLSLLQARSVLKPDGILLIETDVILENDEPVMVFNGLPHNARIRDNYSVWWAPTKSCLFEMLKASLFEVVEETYSEIQFDVPAKNGGRILTGQEFNKNNYKVGRGAVVARAQPKEKANTKLFAELARSYRNPGLDFPSI
jgi:tRNA (mo5U34)-methyltransferase